ncbi:MAG: flagellar biosynthesis anti-sigma factor FlgM [Limnohabitans sp.]|jgi:negative regulator of flagellin synthesis FlgM|uniref:flagellar biosynthesis anti-sigma factor FlgM n=1 Tax=Limnohabitans sp. TaxID=1907725 RepID=UPI0011D35C8D|nr:MAG: flagellar biosynthesis anti-sigma factor FlgM [Limnohabitans sp.]
MTDPISHFGRMAQMDSNVRQAAKAEKRPAANEQALAPQSAGTAPVRQDDEVQLSQVARQAMQEPEFDRAKVEAIKTAIQQGQYPLDARRIAENFVALEKMIKG